jgi:hypothetical protein
MFGTSILKPYFCDNYVNICITRCFNIFDKLICFTDLSQPIKNIFILLKKLHHVVAMSRVFVVKGDIAINQNYADQVTDRIVMNI